jgi:hypothetical protein
MTATLLFLELEDLRRAGGRIGGMHLILWRLI